MSGLAVRSVFALCILHFAFVAGCAGGAGGGLAPRRAEVRDQAALRQRALNLLLRAADSGIDVVQAHAFEALVHVAPDAGRPHFRAALESDVPMVRFAACEAIGDIRDRDALEPLKKRLADRDVRVRLGAAYALCRLGYSGPARLLVQTLIEDRDEFRRSEAAWLLGKLGEPRAAAWLRHAKRREQVTRVRVHIDAALAMLGDREARREIINYTQGDAVSRVIALQTLIVLADPTARDALLYRLEDESDYLQTRLLAARALGVIGSSAGYKLAYEATRFESDDPTETMQVRVNAALALGAIGDARALGRLQALAQSADPRVQVAACWAICQIVPSPLDASGSWP